MKILIVEDNPLNAMAHKERLERASTSVRTTVVSTLSAALEALEITRHEVVVCDLSLPDTAPPDDATPAVKREYLMKAPVSIRDAHPNQAIVVISAHFDEQLKFDLMSLKCLCATKDEAANEDGFRWLIFGAQMHTRVLEALTPVPLPDPMVSARSNMLQMGGLTVCLAFLSVIVALCMGREVPLDFTVMLFLMGSIGTLLGISAAELYKSLPDKRR